MPALPCAFIEAGRKELSKSNTPPFARGRDTLQKMHDALRADLAGFTRSFDTVSPAKNSPSASKTRRQTPLLTSPAVKIAPFSEKRGVFPRFCLEQLSFLYSPSVTPLINQRSFTLCTSMVMARLAAAPPFSCSALVISMTSPRTL